MSPVPPSSELLDLPLHSLWSKNVLSILCTLSHQGVAICLKAYFLYLAVSNLKSGSFHLYSRSISVNNIYRKN